MPRTHTQMNMHLWKTSHNSLPTGLDMHTAELGTWSVGPDLNRKESNEQSYILHIITHSRWYTYKVSTQGSVHEQLSLHWWVWGRNCREPFWGLGLITSVVRCASHIITCVVGSGRAWHTSLN